jgi:hypothetical protein
MENKSRHTPDSKRQNKGIRFYNEAQTIFRYLREHTATASMVAEATGIKQKNICRYKRDLEKAGLLWEVRRDTCQETGHKAWYLTTDPAKAPAANQTQLKLPL